MECRLAYSREWAIRMTHEQLFHAQSSFLTLTYDEVHLPEHGQLVKRDLQLFFKRFRKLIGPFRYVACGEYGETTRRPHFHLAMFGHDFRDDRLLYSITKDGLRLYESSTLHRVWTAGSAKIGDLTFESCAYIARYLTKRISGPGASPLPLCVDNDTGEVVFPNPEFLLCSRRPGIGFDWFHKYFKTDAEPHGRVITSQGTPAPIPRFYKRLITVPHMRFAPRQFALEQLTTSRMYLDLDRKIVEDSPERRAARTTYADSRAGRFKRDTS